MESANFIYELGCIKNLFLRCLHWFDGSDYRVKIVRVQFPWDNLSLSFHLPNVIWNKKMKNNQASCLKANVIDKISQGQTLIYWRKNIFFFQLRNFFLQNNVLKDCKQWIHLSVKSIFTTDALTCRISKRTFKRKTNALANNCERSHQFSRRSYYQRFQNISLYA